MLLKWMMVPSQTEISESGRMLFHVLPEGYNSKEEGPTKIQPNQRNEDMSPIRFLGVGGEHCTLFLHSKNGA